MAHSKHYAELKNLQITINNKKTNEIFVFSLDNSKKDFLEERGKTLPNITSKSQNHKSSIYNVFDESKKIIPRVKTFKSIINSLDFGILQAIGLVCVITVKAVFANNDDNNE